MLRACSVVNLSRKSKLTSGASNSIWRVGKLRQPKGNPKGRNRVSDKESPRNQDPCLRRWSHESALLVWARRCTCRDGARSDHPESPRCDCPNHSNGDLRIRPTSLQWLHPWNGEGRHSGT